MEKYTIDKSNKNKKLLFEKINLLSKTEHEEIYKIVKKFETISFSKNKNGIFFNLSDINDEIYDEIHNFVVYCINNKQSLDDYDKKMNECKINNNYTNIINVNLDSLAKDHKKNEAERLNTIIIEPKSIQKISNYIERITNDKDKICKKRINIKFNNAKKKYANKNNNEKKIDIENMKELQQEEYII